ncbi:MAG: hypothetical protein P9L98_03840 [Candidatus Kaelpia imicola]|nr:hypothetical protein [Candidatus Kaelpia imicola]
MIIFDPTTQDEKRAEQLRDKFEADIEVMILYEYPWAQDLKLTVFTSAEERTKGY